MCLGPDKAQEEVPEMTFDLSIMLSARMALSFFFDLLMPSLKQMSSMYKNPTNHLFQKERSKRRAPFPFTNLPSVTSSGPYVLLLPDACLCGSGLFPGMFGHLLGDLVAILPSSAMAGKGTHLCICRALWKEGKAPTCVSK